MTFKVTPRKKEILIHASRLFKEKGFSATSVRDLAESVNLEPSSLYSHIKSKDELLELICMTCATEFTEGMLLIKEQSNSAKSKIELLIDLHLDVAINNPTAITVFNDEWRHLKEPTRKIFLDLRLAYEKEFKQIIQLAIKDSCIKNQDVEMIMLHILSSIRWIYSNKTINKKSRNKISKSLKTLIFSGISN